MDCGYLHLILLLFVTIETASAPNYIRNTIEEHKDEQTSGKQSPSREKGVPVDRGKAVSAPTSLQHTSTTENIISTVNSTRFNTGTTNVSSTDPILPEWGGNCTKKHWDKCSHLDRWLTSHYKDVKKPELGFEYHETDCKLEATLCLNNKWSVTRCQLLCMTCNREILSKYDKYVRKEGMC